MVLGKISRRVVSDRLARDLARELGKTYTLKDEKIWMQDNPTPRAVRTRLRVGE